jgi:hypothetical protein
MWGWLFIALAALATILTYSYAVREEAVVFSATLATVLWALLALQPDIVLLTEQTTVLLNQSIESGTNVTVSVNETAGNATAIASENLSSASGGTQIEQGDATTTLTLGPVRWVLFGLSALSLLALAASLLGNYPEPEPPTDQKYSDR